MKTKIFIILLFFFASCKEEINQPLEAGGEITENISDISIANLPGAAKLTYTLPSSSNVLYVLAEVEGKNGEVRQFKASNYTNTLLLDGFAEQKAYTVRLYSVNKSEQRSAPIEVEINPGKPPYLSVFETLSMRADFGGVGVDFTNESLANIGVVLYHIDSLKQFRRYGSHYTKLKTGEFTFRGMKAVPNKFGSFVIDKWGNTSDTLYTELTPLFEVEMDKKKFVDITLPGDAFIYTTETNIKKSYLWDGQWSTNFALPYGTYRNVTTNDSNDGRPLHITFDMGVTAKLSRIRMSNYYTYTNRNMKEYKVWGYPGIPPSDGGWAGWVELAHHEQIKPSGLASGYSDEDKKAWAAGDNLNISPTLAPMRYIRIQCLKNYSGNGNMAIAEITLWGSDKIN